jgi:pimeloyl-ACP methyl ester carboxylesterase
LNWRCAVSAVTSSLSPAYRCGSGSALVLVHGVTSSWRAWQPVIPLLAERHEVPDDSCQDARVRGFVDSPVFAREDAGGVTGNGVG